MKRITLMLILTVVSALASPLLQNVEEEIIPAFDGIRDTVFLVFVRQNPTNSQIVDIRDMYSVRNSFFNSARPTRFIIHGFTGNTNSAINTLVTPAYLQAGDFKVIVVDWDAGSLTNAAANTRLVGAAIAYFLDNLFSADAAGVGTVADPTSRIDASDAKYVELIQTEIINWSIPVPVGHANFYPAGGTNQPNCGGNSLCDHMIVIDYFAESLSNPNRFYSQQCSSMDQMRADTCTTPFDHLMGGSTSNYGRSLRGIFRLNVNAARPFAVGRP